MKLWTVLLLLLPLNMLLIGFVSFGSARSVESFVAPPPKGTTQSTTTTIGSRNRQLYAAAPYEEWGSEPQRGSSRSSRRLSRPPPTPRRRHAATTTTTATTATTASTTPTTTPTNWNQMNQRRDDEKEAVSSGTERHFRVEVATQTPTHISLEETGCDSAWVAREINACDPSTVLPVPVWNLDGDPGGESTQTAAAALGTTLSLWTPRSKIATQQQQQWMSPTSEPTAATTPTPFTNADNQRYDRPFTALFSAKATTPFYAQRMAVDQNKKPYSDSFQTKGRLSTNTASTTTKSMADLCVNGVPPFYAARRRSPSSSSIMKNAAAVDDKEERATNSRRPDQGNPLTTVPFYSRRIRIKQPNTRSGNRSKKPQTPLARLLRALSKKARVDVEQASANVKLASQTLLDAAHNRFFSPTAILLPWDKGVRKAVPGVALVLLLGMAGTATLVLHVSFPSMLVVPSSTDGTSSLPVVDMTNNNLVALVATTTTAAAAAAAYITLMRNSLGQSIRFVGSVVWETADWIGIVYRTVDPQWKIPIWTVSAVTRASIDTVRVVTTVTATYSQALVQDVLVPRIVRFRDAQWQKEWQARLELQARLASRKETYTENDETKDCFVVSHETNERIDATSRTAAFASDIGFDGQAAIASGTGNPLQLETKSEVPVLEIPDATPDEIIRASDTATRKELKDCNRLPDVGEGNTDLIQDNGGSIHVQTTTASADVQEDQRGKVDESVTTLDSTMENDNFAIKTDTALAELLGTNFNATETVLDTELTNATSPPEEKTTTTATDLVSSTESDALIFDEGFPEAAVDEPDSNAGMLGLPLKSMSRPLTVVDAISSTAVGGADKLTNYTSLSEIATGTTTDIVSSTESNTLNLDKGLIEANEDEPDVQAEMIGLQIESISSPLRAVEGQSMEISLPVVRETENDDGVSAVDDRNEGRIKRISDSPLFAPEIKSMAKVEPTIQEVKILEELTFLGSSDTELTSDFSIETSATKSLHLPVATKEATKAAESATKDTRQAAKLNQRNTTREMETLRDQQPLRKGSRSAEVSVRDFRQTQAALRLEEDLRMSKFKVRAQQERKEKLALERLKNVSGNSPTSDQKLAKLTKVNPKKNSDLKSKMDARTLDKSLSQMSSQSPTKASTSVDVEVKRSVIANDKLNDKLRLVDPATVKETQFLQGKTKSRQAAFVWTKLAHRSKEILHYLDNCPHTILNRQYSQVQRASAYLVALSAPLFYQLQRQQPELKRRNNK